VHVGDVLALDLAGIGEDRLRGVRVVRVEVDLERCLVADDGTESPSASSSWANDAPSRPSPVTMKFVQYR
jgi:hypothetical protein